MENGPIPLMKKLVLIVPCLMGLYLSGCTVYDPQTGRSVLISPAPVVYEGTPVAYESYGTVPYYYYGGVSYYFVNGRYCYYHGTRPVYINVLPHGGAYNHNHPYYSQRNNPNFHSSHQYSQNNYHSTAPQYQKPNGSGQPAPAHSHQYSQNNYHPSTQPSQRPNGSGQPSQGNYGRGGHSTNQNGKPGAKDQKTNQKDRSTSKNNPSQGQ